jgi:hypothetical protein
MAQYEMFGGDHEEADGTVVKNGQVIESDCPLNEMFPGKFRRYDVAATKTPVKRKSAPSGEQEGGEQGDDVTSEFEGAAELGMTVVKLGRKYSVVNADGETIQAGVTKAAVVNTIESQSEADSEE